MSSLYYLYIGLSLGVVAGIALSAIFKKSREQDLAAELEGLHRILDDQDGRPPVVEPKTRKKVRK